MNYHNITKYDMLNGDGLRVVLWLSGCRHHCKGCQNPETWDPNSGIIFDKDALEEIVEELKKDYISGITFSGGDPLYYKHRMELLFLLDYIKHLFPEKTIWMYTGYSWEQIKKSNDLISIMEYVDVLVDGRFIQELSEDNVKMHWVGSSNQRVINVKETLKKGEIVLWESTKYSETDEIEQSSRNSCDI